MQARVREVSKRLGDETQASNLYSKVIDADLGWEREKGKKGTQWMVIDAGKKRDAVPEEMWSHIEPFVNGGGWEGPVGRLWSDRMV
jgi:hypothetical protein